MTEEQPNKENEENKNPEQFLKKEFEVMNCSLKEMSDKIESLGSRLEKYEGKTKLLEKETELDSYFGSRTTTREMARQALIRSTVEANWNSLEEHPVITNLYLAIKNRRNEQEERSNLILSRFENNPTEGEFFEQLSKSLEVREIREGMDTFDSSLGDLRTTQTYDRNQANKQDLTIHDKMSDFETALEVLEFIGSEHWATIRGAMIFLMGVFAQMGYKEVGEGLRVMLKIPKVENIDDKKNVETTETPKE